VILAQLQGEIPFLVEYQIYPEKSKIIYRIALKDLSGKFKSDC
jgi:hypothetical protein